MRTASSATSSAQLQDYLREVQDALRRADLEKAMLLSNEAVARGLEHSHLLVLAAHHQLELGGIASAVKLATRARDLSPRNVDVLNVLGLSLARQNRGNEAIPIFDSALRQSPGAVTVRFNKAWTLEQICQPKRARAEYERVLDLQPTHVDALAHLAHLAIQRRDLQSARELAVRALALDACHTSAQLALATVDILDSSFDQALRRLESLTTPANTSAINRSIAQGLVGDALEGLERSADAFAAWAASQATLRAFYEPTFREIGTEPPLARVSRITKFFATNQHSDWCSVNDGYAGPPRGHIFLVGFPRSGTTLMEQVLAGHPDVESMEERDCLVDAINEFIVSVDGLDRLAALQTSEISLHRDRYWKRVGAEGISLKKPVFVDKMPLNSVVLCVIAKLFPRAHILFALRDPRDVVFSCFRRRFVMTRQMFELTTLEGASSYYAAVMQLCETYRRVLGLRICDTRYEDLVGNFDTQTRNLCSFIGLEWSDSMRRFAERARSGVINTPSATQVARGLFTEGIGQWRRYRTELAPVLPTLAPWVSRFDYPVD